MLSSGRVTEPKGVLGCMHNTLVGQHTQPGGGRTPNTRNEQKNRLNRDN